MSSHRNLQAQPQLSPSPTSSDHHHHHPPSSTATTPPPLPTCSGGIHHNQPKHKKKQKTTTNHRSNQSKMSRNRLPTLQEVLARQTRPPVDLYCFYLYLQRERAEDSLDFWLDAQQHENLCRAYFKDLRRSMVDLKNEWPGYHQRAINRGSVYNSVNGIARQSALMNDATKELKEKPVQRRSESSSREVRKSGPSPLPPHVSPAVRALFPHDLPSSSHDEDRRHISIGAPRGRTPIQPVIPRSSAITKTDLIASAERIYYRYLMSGSEKEIYLPNSLRIPDFPINSESLPHAGSEEYEVESEFLASIPDLFVSQKEYIYRSMEQDTFPRFLRSKAFGNLTPLSSLVRLSIGLMLIWIGLSLGFSMIFLDSKPQAKRLWVLLPLISGTPGVIGYFYELDPILILFNRSETTPFRTLSIKEKYVQKILRGRAIWVTFMSLIASLAISCILILVPGHRLWTWIIIAVPVFIRLFPILNFPRLRDWIWTSFLLRKQRLNHQFFFPGHVIFSRFLSFGGCTFSFLFFQNRGQGLITLFYTLVFVSLPTFVLA